MKKILMMCLSFWLLCGCAPSYERDESMARLNKVNMDEVVEKIENDETFMFVFTRVDCSSCLRFKEEVLAGYIVNHGFDFNEVVLEKDSDDYFKAVAFVAKHPNPEEFLTDETMLPSDVFTPTFYFVEKGEVKEIYIGGDLSEKEFDELIQRFQLDKKEQYFVF